MRRVGARTICDMERKLIDDRRLDALAERLPELLTTAPPSVEAILARAAASDGEAPVYLHQQPRFWMWLLATAALLSVAIPATLLLLRSETGAGFGAQSFVTGTNETAAITLSDGSVVKLAPRTRLELEPSRSERRVVLDGQGFFAVAHKKRQPFVIRTTSGEVRVLGTRFDLSARDDDLQLVVVEGRVTLSASGREAHVRAGEVTRVVNGTALPVQPVGDAAELTAWVGQFIAFQATPLHDAAREIMQHYEVHIEIDPALRERTITAWFSDWALEDVMIVFCTVAEALCERTNGVIKVTQAQHRDDAR